MNDNDQNMTRGSLLQTLALAPMAVAGAFAAAGAEADATAMGSIPPKSVQYQSMPKNGQQCSTCKFYINNAKSKTANGGCTQVAGPISPKGWCVVYSKGDNSKQKM
jgi:hypothetical protein